MKALQKYPDYDVVANTEIASGGDLVLDSEISHDEVLGVVQDSLEAAGSVGDAFDMIGDFLPGLPVVSVIDHAPNSAIR